MSLLRFILIALAVWVAVQIVRRVLTQHRKRVADQKKAAAHSMVRCAHCGLHVPETEAVQDGGRYFCSNEHRLEEKRSR